MLELGFVRNESARQLRAGTSRTLAYVMLDAGNPFFTDVAQGIEIAAEAVDLSLVLCNSRNSPSASSAHLRPAPAAAGPGHPGHPGRPGLADARRGRRRGTPVVIVDRTRTDRSFCSVAVDDVLGGRLAVEHLVDRGHPRVAYVGGPFTSVRCATVSRAPARPGRAAGLPADDLSSIETDRSTSPAAARPAPGWSGCRPRRPTAAFCANDLTALGLLQHAISSGVRVPEELAIVGYDDIEFAAAAAVPLTSVRQPRRELGRTAAELVLDEATNPEHDHRQVLFTPELVARESTRA